MKASNIYQKLKSAGIGNPDGVSSKPLIKDVGIKSPLNMKSAPKSKKKDGESMTPYSVDKKTGKGVIHGPKVSYDMAYKNRGKQYKDMSKAEYIKEAKRQTKSFESTGNWDASGKKKSTTTNSGGSKTNILPKNTDTNKKKTTTTDTNKKKTTTTNTTTTNTKSKVDVAKEKVDTANKNIKDVKKSVKEDRKAKKLEEKATRKQKRADRIKKEGGTKVGNFLRGAKDKIKNIGKKKKKDDDDISVSAAKMKKSPMKMKKGAPAKMAKSPNKFNAGLKKAAADGKLDKNPKFKAAVENAPAKMKKSAMKMKKSAMKMGMKKSAAKMKYKK